ncbi:MAG TPA: sigma-70 family RNA polymerase sigma factor [Steroidobacteraceae bacterium]|jgi:RNA polymerase sigma-70 factor (ECF subfamily)|nr:sigma-70 family RNA polymerase sigma factor [Steroidobacteraceae bacterium]
MIGSGRERLKQRRFEALCEPCRGEMFRFALWLSRSHQVAEEVVQETFLRAWRSLDALKDDSTVKSWLLTIARREHARLYERKRHPTVNIDELAAAEASCLAATTDRDPDEVQDVRKAIFELDEEHREPLILQVLMGYSTQEIAELMRLNEGAVSTRLFRARNRLRARLGLGADESTQEDDNAAR